MGAQRICLDTTFLIDLLRGLPAATEKARQFNERGCDLSTTTVNVFEVHIGALRSESAKRMIRLEALLTDLRILWLGRREAEEAASIMVTLGKKGQPIEMRDALIAGCMLTNAYSSIVTRNVTDFERITRIEVLSY
jgi:predicted nucleic acid-binding protein